MKPFTIRQYTGLPGLQDLVELLSKALVAGVTEQVVLSPAVLKVLLSHTHTHTQLCLDLTCITLLRY